MTKQKISDHGYDPCEKRRFHFEEKFNRCGNREDHHEDRHEEHREEHHHKKHDCFEDRHKDCRHKEHHEKKHKYCDPCHKYRPHKHRRCNDHCVQIVRISRVREERLVSNLIQSGVSRFDPNLVNAWGLVLIDNVFWVVANGTSSVLTYDSNGNILPTVVSVLDNAGAPAGPTGIVHNTTAGFQIHSGNLLFPSLWLVATEAGTINAYNPTFNPANSVVVVNRSGVDAVYKGLAIASNHLYAADFHNNRIDVFDSNFNLVAGFPFVDPVLPAGFAPFNIYNLNGLLYVTYALQDPPENEDDLPGPGNGFINIFNPDGSFVRRFFSRGVLNSPWGVVAAPRSLGLPVGALLVGNFGDGYINIFESDGEFIGRLKDCNRNDIHIDGLWGLITNFQSGLFGSGNTLYFAAGPNHERDGLFGRLVADCPECRKHCD